MFRGMRKMLYRSSRRLMPGGENKAPVRRSRRLEEKIYLADKMRSDDNSTLCIPEKTRSKAKSVDKEKARVKKRKFSRVPRLIAAESNLAGKMSSDDDSRVSIPKKVINKEKARVKRRKFSRDPRLGTADRLMETVRRAIEDWDEPVEPGVIPDYCDMFETPDIDTVKEDKLLKAYCKKHSKSGEEWFAEYIAELKDLEENEEEYLAERDYNAALKAVKFYNRKHSTKYVLEETLGSYSRELDDGFWAHCNFRAKNTQGPAGRRPVSRLFFAELFRRWHHSYKVDSCVTLDGPGRCRDVVHGCEICPKWVRHPVNEFKNGHPDEYTAL